jgi:hypothetical protein
MPIGPGQPGQHFTREGILSGAPNTSGVYALYHTGWVYFGESNDIQRRLLEHLNEAGSAILRNAPTAFCFEFVHGDAQRIARQNQLIAAYATPCNQRMG